MFCLFLTFADARQPLPAFSRALVHTPDRANDPYLDDGAPPARVVQGYFESLPELEAAAAVNAALQCAAEAMSARQFLPSGEEKCCTYLVAYEGPAEDESAWHAAYLAGHPALMAKLPAIRALEVYLPLEWRCPRPWRKERSLQRNKVAFDSAAALSAALASPVRKEMRAHYARLPAFRGRVTHFAMSTSAL